MNRFIVLTSSAGALMYVNPLFIAAVQHAPRNASYLATVLVDGHWHFVLEKPEEILQKISEWAKGS